MTSLASLIQLKSAFCLLRATGLMLSRRTIGTRSFRQLHTSSALLGTHEVKMPSLSPTMTEGTIVKWLKKEGDPIQPGDALCEIQTDKAVLTLDWDDDGVLAKIVVPENAVDVKVGSLIALTVDEGDDWQSVEAPGASAPTGSVSPPAADSAAIMPEAVQAGIHLVNMPSLSPTMTEGTIVQWLKKEGDAISPGDALCEIQTDKAIVTMEWDDEGVLAKILAPAGSTDVKVGSLIALTADEGVDWKLAQIPTATTTTAPKAGLTPKSGSRRLLLGPAVSLALKKYGLTPTQLSGSGPHGTVMKEDVHSHVKKNNLKPVSQDAKPAKASAPSSKSSGSSPLRKGKKGSPAKFVDLEISNMRRTIAKRLLQSKSTIPHAYSVVECNVQYMSFVRKQLKTEEMKVSVNDVLIKCVANALMRVPAVNCVWEGDKLVNRGLVDISVAVATPNGLITPIVFNVGDKDVVQISQNVKILATKAKEGKLQPNEFMGGTFSVSNLGMFGIHEFSAIINPPQCAILAIGGNISGIDSRGKPLTTVQLTLSYDARAISNQDAAKFLANLKSEIESVSLSSLGIYDMQSKKEMLEMESLN